jgi:hypothetical protein
MGVAENDLTRGRQQVNESAKEQISNASVRKSPDEPPLAAR